MEPTRAVVEVVDSSPAAKGANGPHRWRSPAPRKRAQASCPIFGTRRLDRVKENLGAVEVSFPVDMALGALAGSSPGERASDLACPIGKHHLDRTEVFLDPVQARVPKIGPMLGPLARSQASATCAA